MVVSPTRAQESKPFQELRKSIESRLAQENVPSLAVAVAKDGKVLWADAIGWADVEKRRPATVDTMYCLGSVSKPITATGLMVLVERGKLALDEPANSYLGDAKLRAYVGDAGQATVRRLANHTSGLARHDLYADERHGPLSVDERLRRYGCLVREPGETYEYSNLGYMVLAHIIARQSGKPFLDFMRDEVFLPLGMTNSAVGVDLKNPGAAATSYGADRKPKAVPTLQDQEAGHGGIYASALDLLRFGMVHLKQPAAESKRLLSDPSLDLMHEPTARTAPFSWYGIGWRTEEAEFGYRALMHTGQTDGATACLVLIPEHRLGIVAMTNLPHPLPWQMTHEIVKQLLPAGQPPKKPADGHERFGRREFQPTKEWTGHWRGAIKTLERDMPVEMWMEPDGKVLVQLKDQTKAAAGGVRIEDGYLRGSFDADLGIADVTGVKYRLHFKLTRRGENIVNGSITASSREGERVLTLSHWMDLQRTP